MRYEAVTMRAAAGGSDCGDRQELGRRAALVVLLSPLLGYAAGVRASEEEDAEARAAEENMNAVMQKMPSISGGRREKAVVGETALLSFEVRAGTWSACISSDDLASCSLQLIMCATGNKLLPLAGAQRVAAAARKNSHAGRGR